MAQLEADKDVPASIKSEGQGDKCGEDEQGNQDCRALRQLLISR